MGDPVARAQALLGLPVTGQGRVHAVRRVDAAGGAYQLVCVDGRLACLEVPGGRLLASADSAVDPVALTAQQARARAGLGAAAAARLVWAPSAATRSMFDPVWEVAVPGRTLYVDQRGAVWPALAPAPMQG
jgi:hypothetical protein